MRQNKNAMRTLIVLAIALVLYCVLVFAIPFHRGVIFRLSFVFTLIALAAQLYVLKTSFDHGEGARSKFYGFPIARIGLIYLAVQFIAGLACMALGTVLPTWVAVLLFVLILGVSAIGLISAEAVRDEAERQDRAVHADIETMRALQSQASSIAAQCQDPVLGHVLASLAEQFRFSDPVSSPQTAAAEADLAEMVDLLQTAVMERDPDSALVLVSQLEAALAQRNELCKLSKRSRS